MSLQTAITEWRDFYDAYLINGSYSSNYIGSIRDVNGNYHYGGNSYETGLKGYDFNWYAAQGVLHSSPTIGGSKFLVESTTGFSWNSTDVDADGLLEFVTSGTLNNLYLGYTPTGDNNSSPAAATLTKFAGVEPLLVLTGFNIAIDSVASSVFGVANGNSAIPMSGTLASIMWDAQLFETGTLNAVVLYSLAHDYYSPKALEFVLDKYLESKGSDITDSFEDIETALNGTGVSIRYYEEANDYVSGGVITSAVAQVSLAESASDLLQAA